MRVGRPRIANVAARPSNSSQDLAEVLEQTPETLAQYSLIIAVDVNPNYLPRLSDVAWEHGIPLIKVRSCGFYGSLRTQIRELTSACFLSSRASSLPL